MPKLWRMLVALLGSAAPLAAAHAQPVSVILDGTSGGKIFDGIGATSASTSYLLFEYPEPERSQVLDYLFKPNYGAALQVLKIEVGGDGSSGFVGEPSHMRSATEQNYSRGVEWWLATEALKRNPQIKIVALAWSFPKWVASTGPHHRIDPQKAADYLTNFVSGAKTVHHIDLYCMGVWNETTADTAFIKALRRELNARATGTKVCGDDTFAWKIVGRMSRDGELRDAIDVITNHYPGSKLHADVQAKSTDWQKPTWSSEDGPWVEEWGSNGDASRTFPSVLIRNYAEGRLTSTNIWALITAYYPIGPILYAGLMRADTPWSGHYEVKSPLWAVAHTTQFAQPGWRYIDSASGVIPRTGSYVTLHLADQYSVIVETMRASEPVEMNFTIAGGLSDAPLSLWRSNAATQFERIGQVQPVGGKFSYRFDPQSLYSLTTTNGQHKGDATPPPDKDFPAPWHPDFTNLPIGRTPPPLFAVVNGAYDVADCPGGHSGHCLRQVLGTAPILWFHNPGNPWVNRSGEIPPTGSPALGGDLRWRDYRVSADVFIEQTGEASLIGRTSNIDGAGAFTGYRFRLYDTGHWILHGDSRDRKLLASGQYKPSRGVWRKMELAMQGHHLTGQIDGHSAFSLDDDSQPAGMAGIGTNFNQASFDHIDISPIAADVPMISATPAVGPHRPPDPVVDLFVPTPGDQSVMLNWKTVAQADGYRLRYGPDAKKRAHVMKLGKVNHVLIDGLTNGKTYYFELAAFNAKGEGERSYVQKAVPASD